MTTCAVIGTCLANITSVFLIHEYRWERLNNASGIRSDRYVDYFIDRTRQMPSMAELLQILRFEPKSEAEMRQRLNENYIETCGRFKMTGEGPTLFETIEKGSVDVFLLDNLYDIERPSAVFKHGIGGAGFSLDMPMVHFANLAELRHRFEWSEHLSGHQSAQHWARIVEYIQSRQPQAKIFFLCGHYCTSLDDLGRYRRAVEFYESFKDLGSARQVHVVPPLDLDAACMKSPDDFFHYDMSVYKALAGYIQSYLIAKWPIVRGEGGLPGSVLSLAGLETRERAGPN